jgi:hypothetical protein
LSIEESKAKEAVEGLKGSLTEYSNERVTFVNTTDLREALAYIADLEKQKRGVDFVRERCAALIAQADRHKDDTYTDSETRVELAKIAQLGSAAETMLADLAYALRGDHIPYTT